MSRNQPHELPLHAQVVSDEQRQITSGQLTLQQRRRAQNQIKKHNSNMCGLNSLSNYCVGVSSSGGGATVPLATLSEENVTNSQTALSSGLISRGSMHLVQAQSSSQNALETAMNEYGQARVQHSQPLASSAENIRQTSDVPTASFGQPTPQRPYFYNNSGTDSPVQFAAAMVNSSNLTLLEEGASNEISPEMQVQNQNYFFQYQKDQPSVQDAPTRTLILQPQFPAQTVPVKSNGTTPRLAN